MDITERWWMRDIRHAEAELEQAPKNKKEVQMTVKKRQGCQYFRATNHKVMELWLYALEQQGLTWEDIANYTSLVETIKDIRFILGIGLGDAKSIVGYCCNINS